MELDFVFTQGHWGEINSEIDWVWMHDIRLDVNSSLPSPVLEFDGFNIMLLIDSDVYWATK